MDDKGIRTQFDELLSSLKRAGGSPISVQSLSAGCGMSEGDVVKWLHVLERSGHVQLENKLDGVYAAWTGKAMKEPEHPRKPVEIVESTRDIDIARGHEKLRGKPPEIKKIKVQVAAADMEMVHVSEQLEKIDEMIAKLREQKENKARIEQKKQSREEELAKEGQRKIAALAEDREKEAKLLAKEKELVQQKEEGRQRLEEEKRLLEEDLARQAKAAEDLERKLSDFVSAGEDEVPPGADESKLILPQEPSKPKPKAVAKAKAVPKAAEKPPKEAQPFQQTIAPLEKLPPRVAAKISITPKAGKREPIRRQQPVRIAPQSLEFSERLATQVKKIIDQTQEMEKLRLEKERILKEHYLPMQRKLEVEVETISDRVLRMEKGILSMQERASQLPNKVTAAEKLQHAAVKAHKEMRRTYDDASALIEESTRELADEREKMELIVDQSRQEISEHSAKREELERSLKRLTEMEEQAEGRVTEARSTLAEQAERLSSAENFLQQLSSLRDEIQGSVGELKSEIATTKGVLTGVQNQMEQMRQVELWAESIRQDYDTKMSELDDYIRHGNEEFDNLRESVETNFVRRYLRELRQLTESYSFEFGQAQQMEKGIDERISEERTKLEGLLEEGRRISQLYELQAKETPGSEKFEGRGEMFRSLSQITSERQQIEQMISQIVQRGAPSVSPTASRLKIGKKTEIEKKPANVISMPIRSHRKIQRAAPAKKTAKPAKAVPSKKAPEKKTKTASHKKGRKR